MPSEKEVQVVYVDKMKTPEPLSFQDIRLNTKLVKQALRDVMTKGSDYGTVPGCGEKLGLFKAGAEKLMLLFKLGCFPDVQRLHDDPDALEFIVRTRIVHIPSGVELGVGLGSASSSEEKYKWREATKKEWLATPEERRRIKYRRGDYDKKTRTYGPERETLQVRTNPADLNNTLLKMACKRSKVDGVITCTGASDIFTQDIEDDGVPSRQVDESPIQRPLAKGQKAPDKVERVPEGENAPENAPEAIIQADKQEVPIPPDTPCPTPQGFVSMKAKFDSKCGGCEAPVKEGAEIFYKKGAGAYHKNVTCTAELP